MIRRLQMCLFMIVAACIPVTEQGLPAAILSFTAMPTAVLTEQPVVLAWSSENAQSCEIDGVAIGGVTNGSVTVNPLDTIAYTLVCRSEAAVDFASVAVVVTLDTDRDGLSDEDEADLGTNPNDADTDDDGLIDSVELDTDPLDPDTDGDGLCDFARVDNDGDGIDPADGCTDQEMLFVDGAAAAGGDGLTWASAFDVIQDGVDAAVVGQQVWVTSGRYFGSAANVPVITMKDGVEVRGGFQAGELSRSARGHALDDPTILDGDFDGSGTETADDAVHVILGAPNIVLEGLLIVAGHADADAGTSGVVFPEDGAGMHGGGTGNDNQDLSTVVFFRNMSSVDDAGAYYTTASTGLRFDNILFLSNSSADQGGAVYPGDSSETFMSNVTFQDNASGTDGGGMHTLRVPTTSRFDGVTFRNNRATLSGGGLSLQGTVGMTNSPVLSNVTFMQNTADLGGGLYFLERMQAVVVNVTFWGNMATTQGGGVDHRGSGGGGLINANSFTNVVFANNASPSGPDFFSNGDTPTILNTCTEEDLDATIDGSDGQAAGMVQNSVVLTASPTDVPWESAQIYLDPAGPDTACIDLGDDAAANAVGVPWATQTTSPDGALDATPVDAGRHYEPDAVLVTDMSSTPTDVDWTTSNAEVCLLFNDADTEVQVIRGANLAMGTTPHGRHPGITLWLACFGDAGEPAVGRLTL